MHPFYVVVVISGIYIGRMVKIILFLLKKKILLPRQYKRLMTIV
nr:MAG TPA: hypothetical protein [Caudoviricetes sp.]